LYRILAAFKMHQDGSDGTATTRPEFTISLFRTPSDKER